MPFCRWGVAVAAAAAVACLCPLVVNSVKTAEHRCKGCRDLVEGFKREYDETEGKNSGGGNSEWEEARGIKWSTSETRLAEIMEKACKPGENDCLDFVEMADEQVEEWWRERRETGKAVSGKASVALKTMASELCVDTTKTCCKKGYWGKTCKVCPGGRKTPCTKHGECSGDGTRGGNGTCACEKGYKGKKCSKCKTGYWRNETMLKEERADAEASGSKKPNNFTCVKCHDGCIRGCTGPGLDKCNQCKDDGYKNATDGPGCEDIDECTLEGFDPKCRVGQYCNNTEGSFQCAKCDRGCNPDKGCTAAGPKACKAGVCADGFKLDPAEGCVDIDECTEQSDFCDTDEYCLNMAGTAQCFPCADACAKGKGCVNAKPDGCKECGDGYEPIPEKEVGCQDIDECLGAGICLETETCRNTDGSFECDCAKGWYKEHGKCVDPKAKAAAAAAEAEAEAAVAEEAEEEEGAKDPADL